jgi:DNA-binding CsgD family transcriptional regulator
MMRPLPNAAEARLAEVIRRLGGPEFESVLHDWLRRCLAPDNLIVLAYRDSGPPQVLYRQSDSPQVFSQLEKTYLAGAYLLDPYHALHTSRVAAGVYRLRDVAPDAFQRSQYFTEYYQQTTLLDELTFIAYPKPDVSLNICLGRDANSARAFTLGEVALAQRLAPILTALVEQHWAGLAPGGGVDDITADVMGALQQHHGIRLSPRQAEVALMILRGHSTPAIGLRLGLSPQTVKVFRRQLYAKCTISSQAELFALMMPLLRISSEPEGV